MKTELIQKLTELIQRGPNNIRIVDVDDNDDGYIINDIIWKVQINLEGIMESEIIIKII